MNCIRSTVVFLSLFVLLGVIACSDSGNSTVSAPESPEEQTAAYFKAIRNNPSELRKFFLSMPKGGDIHHHLTGAVYAETLIDLAAAQDLCVNPDTCQLFSSPCKSGETIPVSQAYEDWDLYNKLVDNWSLRNSQYFNSSPHDHFFAIFGEIAPAEEALGGILAVLRARAAEERVYYLETMIQIPTEEEKVIELAKKLGWDDDLYRFYEKLIEQGLGEIAQSISARLHEYYSRSSEILQCGSAHAEPGCNVTVRFQYYALRTLPREQVFSEMALAFEVADKASLVVGVNLVGPEDDYTALYDYSLHMQMVDFLHGIYPDVKIDLHAGELDLGLVPPEDLRFHVSEAIQVGHANRIGHGVDISYELESKETLKVMAQKPIAIEILLTSNKDLLDVSRDTHPFPVYLAQNVPIIIATDDPGILRTDLTEQFVLCASWYSEVGYRDIKRFVRNSLEFSFLPGDSVWASGMGYSQIAAACAEDTLGTQEPSTLCKDFLEKSEKAMLQWQIEGDLMAFEKTFCSECE